MSAAAISALAYQEPGKLPSVLLAVLVHVLLATFLFFGVRWQSSQPEVVEVELWNNLSAPTVEKAEVKPEPVIEPKPAPPPPKPEVERKVEPPKPDIALEKKLKKEPPKEPRLNLDRSKDIRAELDRELAPLNAQAEKNRILDQMKRDAAAAASREKADWTRRIIGKIKPNVVIPPDLSGNPEAIFDVVQLPTGEVMSAKLRKSSGHKGYDEAVERAILKSSPLPKPDKPELFERSLELKFRPQDLR